MNKNETVRCETIDSAVVNMVKSAGLDRSGIAHLGAPFPVEEKEFLLTRNGQSVMNIFTASGNRVSICIYAS
jgi:hypothetical protein